MESTSPTLTRVFVDSDMAEPALFSLPSSDVVAYSSRCPGRNVNEDGAALVSFNDGRSVLAVADGLGGQQAGDRAARLALEVVTASLVRAEKHRLREAILDGLEQANREVQELRLGAGTTFALVEIRGPFARAYHVGDSQILIVGQRGKLKLEIVPHSPVGYGVEAGLLDQREAMEHQDRHLLSNLIGSPDMRIEMGSILRLSPRDTVLLGTDGLFDNLHLEEIVERVRKGKLAQAADRLAKSAGGRMRNPRAGLPSKPDDLTFMLYRPHNVMDSRSRS